MNTSDMPPRYLNADEMQKHCETMGVNDWVNYAGDACCSSRPVGLCARCKQPISYHFTNGGKLSPARTLRLQHVFSGDIRCEDPATNLKLAAMTGEQKAQFFVDRHDDEMLKSVGYTDAQCAEWRVKNAERRNQHAA